jgi:glycerophosphoryl diester phosphodiesterase
MAVINLPAIIGHRGSPREAPENTVAALEAAGRAGADGVEIDVRVAADGTVVVLHDADVDRTTAGRGPVASRTGSDLAALGVPTLADVAAVCDRLGLFLNVEVKEADPVIATALAQWQPSAGGVVSSFLAPALEQVGMAAPHLDRGLLTLPGMSAEQCLEVALAMGSQAWNPFVATVLAEPESVARAHERGLAVHVWTVDDPEQIRALARLGVDAIITNVPAAARAALVQS